METIIFELLYANQVLIPGILSWKLILAIWMGKVITKLIWHVPTMPLITIIIMLKLYWAKSIRVVHMPSSCAIFFFPCFSTIVCYINWWGSSNSSLTLISIFLLNFLQLLILLRFLPFLSMQHSLLCSNTLNIIFIVASILHLLLQFFLST